MSPTHPLRSSRPRRFNQQLQPFRSLPLALLLAATQVFSAPLLLNEYNAVDDGRFLATDTLPGAANADAFFGRILGNGGDWVELVVVTSQVDIRGWSLDWSYRKDTLHHGEGRLRVGKVAALTNLRPGTLITVTERPSADDWGVAL